MAHHRTSQPLPAGFRRRFPLELSPDEYEVLEAAGKIAGSKRAALLAGLAALSDSAKVSADAERGAREGASARARTEKLETRVAELTGELTEAKNRAASASSRHRKATDTLAARLQDATERAELLADDIQAARQSRISLEAETDRLGQLVLDELRCPRCGRFAPASEWATKEAEAGRLVYHQPCGFHEGGLLDETSVMGRKRLTAARAS